MKILKRIGWEILEYLRRAVTPFAIKMMFGMTMFVLLLIENTELRMILMFVLLVCDELLSFVLFRAIGEHAYKMKQAGLLGKENKPIGSAGALGVYRPSKEYRPYKGFVIAVVSCIPAIALMLATGLGGNLIARMALMLIYGWAYAPVVSFYMIGALGSASEVQMIPVSSVWFSFIIIGVYCILSAVAYILGGQKEKMRIFMLERSAQTIEKGRRQNLDDAGERKR